MMFWILIVIFTLLMVILCFRKLYKNYDEKNYKSDLFGTDSALVKNSLQ